MQDKSKKIIQGIFCCFFLAIFYSSAQVEISVTLEADPVPTKFWVFFTDKKDVTFNPYEYFDGKTIENRLRQNISLIDSTDFPVNENYIFSVKSLVDSASYCSRWFNGIAVYASEKQIELVRSLVFVREAEPMFLEADACAMNNFEKSLGSGEEVKDFFFDTTLSDTKRELMINQTKRLGLEEFEKRNIDGRGIRIAVFDAGFPTVDISPSFDHLRKNNQILKTWDFVKNKEFVYDYNAHGTMVLSCIAGRIGNQKTGLAQGAEFILARTEMAKREPFAEEEYWLAAAEWADKSGANIISSSLAYTYHRYFRKDMDGKKSLVSKAATMAASKGILVVNAAGNDGKNEWKIIATPSDADSVLTVGGISPASDYHISFSSFGPTADKRMKPNVCAYGQVVVAGKKGAEESYGTSFSTPLVAGFAACAWQMKRNMTNMELFNEIEKSADLYPYFDYAHGFGVPQASYFANENKENQKPTFDFIEDNYSLKVVIRDEFCASKKESFENIEQAVDEAVSDYQNYMYYHIQNLLGYLDKYYVLRVMNAEALDLDKQKFLKGQRIQVFYKGYSETYIF